MNQNITDFNQKLSSYLWMDFEIFYSNGNLVLSGGIDELAPEKIRACFITPFFVSCPICFTYDNGILIEEIVGQDFFEKCKKYSVPKENKIFRLNIDSDADSYFIISKSCEVFC